MWSVSPQWRETLAFSHVTQVRGAVTLNGAELAQIEPASWSWKRELRGSQVTDEMSLSVLDPDGRLFTPSPDAPLRANGQRVTLTGTLSSGQWAESVPMGVWRIEEAEAEGGPWRLYRNGKWARPAQTVDVSTSDLLELVAEYDWLGLSIPPAGSTSRTEMRRIVDGAMPVRLDMEPKVVPQVPWEQSRIDALIQVVSDLDAVAVIDRTGILTAIPRSGSGKSIDITPADAQQPLAWGLGLIDWKAPSSRDGAYNGVVMTGTNADGDTLYGRALEQAGPSRWSSAGFGRKLYKAASPLLTSQPQVDLAAAARLRSLRRDQSQVVTITTVPDFSVDVLDTARILLPDTDRPVAGLITAISMASEAAMTLTVSIPWGVQISG